ncbi:hypothetical protein ACQPW3_11335 [Actinosynnema sp. CA-248983]
MLTAFWTGLGQEFSKQWAARALTAALAFWSAGVAAMWWSAHGAGVGARGWAAELTASAKAIGALPGLTQGLLLVGGLALVAVSAALVERVTLPVLRLLEGYWSRPRRLRAALVGRRARRHARWAERVATLATRQRLGSLSPAEFRELRAPATDPERVRELRAKQASGFDAAMAARLGRGRAHLRHTPRSDAMRMPTRLGDIVRAAELRPAEKYGLDAVVCWNALWVLLPDGIKTELVQARTELDRAIRSWVWGVLFLVWTPWTWWAAVVAVVVPTTSYYVGALGAARLFGELTGTAFDLHRFDLYDKVRLPRPTSPAEERRVTGPRVTNQLWGGLSEPVDYLHPESPSGTQ